MRLQNIYTCQQRTTRHYSMLGTYPPRTWSSRFHEARQKVREIEKTSFWPKWQTWPWGGTPPGGGTPGGGLPPYQRLINSENGKITLSMDGFGVKIWGSAGNFGVFGLWDICQKSQKSAQATLDILDFFGKPHKVLGFYQKWLHVLRVVANSPNIHSDEALVLIPRKLSLCLSSLKFKNYYIYYLIYLQTTVLCFILCHRRLLRFGIFIRDSSGGKSFKTFCEAVFL